MIGCMSYFVFSVSISIFRRTARTVTRVLRNRFSDRRATRKRAALTLLTYVLCGLSLTAHIALADHHCEDHCSDAPFSRAAPTTLTSGGHCSFDHHVVEEHHEEAVNPDEAFKFISPAMMPSGFAPDLVDLYAAKAMSPDTASPWTAHGPPKPARAPPVSLSI